MIKSKNKLVDFVKKTLALPTLNNQIENEVNVNSIDSSNETPKLFQINLSNREFKNFLQDTIQHASSIPRRSSRQENPEVEEVTPTVDSERPTNNPPRGGFWNFIKAFMNGLRSGDHQTMLGKLVQQLTNFVQGMTNFFTGSNDTTLGSVEREFGPNRGRRTLFNPSPSPPSSSSDPKVGIRTIRAKRMAADDLLSIFSTNTSQVEKQLKQGVRDIEQSLDNLWSQLQSTFSKENVNQVLKKFDLDEEQLEETKQIAKELHERVGMAWRQLSKEVANRVDVLTQQVNALGEGLAASASTPKPKSNSSAIAAN